MTRQTTNWWGDRWLDWLRSFGVGPESEGQARSALRADGQVQIGRGEVRARVWVSERRQVQAVLRLKPWSDRDWKRATEAIAGSEELSRRVLSGTMGAELEEALDGLGLVLFPEKATLGCGCGPREPRCRHINFLALQTAEALAGSPFLWLEVLGRNRTELLDELKARLSDRAPAAAAPEGEAGELEFSRFWQSPLDPATIAVRPGGSAAPDGLIRSLGPLPVEEPLHLLPSREQVRAEEFLRRMVVTVANRASALALGESEPAYRPSVLPGKPVSLASRLVQEVEEAVRAEEGMLLIDDLIGRCPTLLAAGDAELAKTPLREALTRLPADLTTVAGRYVGPAGALLRGATFHHTVTFAEWLEGEAGDDADWCRALAAAGRTRPSLAPWFRRLKPEVGDQLLISPGESGLEVRLLRRGERHLDEPLHSDALASRLLQVLIGMTPAERLAEQEAVAALLAEGGYRGDLQPDPIWLLPLLGPGLYLDPAERAVTRLPNSWRPGFPRFIYSNWARDQAVMAFQALLMKRWAPRREIEQATACITWWSRCWTGAQDQPEAAQSLGPFLHFLWNHAPREAHRYRLAQGQVPVIMEQWFAFLEERYPASAGAFTRHRRACGLLEHYADRCRTAPPEGAPEGAILAWQAEGFRWIGPAGYLSGGSYR